MLSIDAWLDEKLPFAADIVVEIRSPDDREITIRRKTELYLTHGATLVTNINPQTRTVRLSGRDLETNLSSGDAMVHAAFPDLRIQVDDVFAPLGEID
jgi:Uma2 family endonuclease